GTKIEPYYNRSALIDVTTETVRKNLLEGMILVTLILLMFLGNVRSSIIVAINIPLALMFAFCVLFLRSKSANLLSIGAVDFGIIVDSTVIMVEHIFHSVSSGENSALPLQDRVLKAARHVERSLFYSTVIMVCALLPLFTMQGPEGQIFGPMADTYAFALGGALILALTISPVLCIFCFGHLKPAKDNLLVRSIKRVYLFQLKNCLDHRWLWTGGITLLVAGTIGTLPLLGREFMPELEEGNIVVRGTFPVNVSLDEAVRNAHIARRIMLKFPEVKLATSQVGRPDDGTDPTGYYNTECFVPLKRRSEWPIPPGDKRPRTKAELIEELSGELSRNIIGVNWDFSQYIRDNVMESLSGVKGENSVKIFGPDLDQLETMAVAVYNKLDKINGISDPGVFRIKGQTNLAFPIDRAKCAIWNVRVSDIEDVIQTAVGGKPFTQMLEGEKSFNITLRWPERLRQSMDYILDIPVDVVKNRVTSGSVASLPGTAFTGSAVGLSLTGTAARMPALTGSLFNATLDDLSRVPRRRLRDLVTPLDAQGRPDPNSSFVQPGASTIYREQGNRLIAVKFGVRGRDLASTVADAQTQTAPLVKPGYSTTWSGEFQQMREAEHRMLIVIILSIALILIMLYLAFFSLLDAFLVFANVGVMSIGGVWTLLLTGLNFNISAAVGFISILGVAVMNGLLMVSSFNNLRYHKVPLREAILEGTETLVRPITMTALAAILGLLPAAFSTAIGSQSQRPLAIVVVGGMLSTLVFFNLVPLLYSFYGHREPLVGVGHVHE
ncbi:MAG TPA: efflux RND transporter permease subunit, partial [Planctomycetaceae bacterium]|nr:efflux RND transporter permease subunit [Planctomycetaceae bacterium]